MAKKRRLKKKYKIFIILLILIIGMGCWSRFISTTGLNIKEYKVLDKNLPSSFDGLKIVHFTDVHYGRTVNKKELDYLVSEINALKPDIIVFTGDLIDRDTKLTQRVKETVTNSLSNMKASIGKYAVTGNHDLTFKDYKEIIDGGGFINLDNTYNIIYSSKYETLFIAGLESEIKGHPNTLNITTYLDSNNGKDDKGNPIIVNDIPAYKILLLHTPDSFDKFKNYHFNLVLAGHSHNGQIRFPFLGATFTPLGAKKYYDPYYQINKTNFFISGGLGTSDIDFRFFNKPSFNFYRLTTK